MSTETTSRFALLRRLLDEALRARGGYRSGEYGLFWTGGEGRFLPNSTADRVLEETSGYLVDKYGGHFLFWFGWDDEEGTPGITLWQPTEPEPDWTEDEEYQAARQSAGLED